MPGVCVVGSFMMDLVVRAPRRPRSGETLVGSGFETFLGGKGFNQAVAAARSGAAVSMVGRLGADDFGQAFRDAMDRSGIDDAGVTTDDDSGTGVATPLVEDSGENSIVIVPRANHEVGAADLERSRTTITGADVVLLQLELPFETVVACARMAKDGGATVVLNPAPAVEDLSAFAGIVDLVTPNESEARLVVGRDAPPDELAAIIRQQLSATVVMTLGGEGALVSTTDGTSVRCAPHAVDVVDTVGAGDAFCGALGATLSEGADLESAVERANAAGALAVTRPGAEPSMPHRSDIDRLLAG